jgi:hypothetical protein
MVFESKNRRKKFHSFCLLLSLFFCSLSFSLVFILALLDCFFLHYDTFLLAFHSFFHLSQLFINIKYDYKFIEIYTHSSISIVYITAPSVLYIDGGQFWCRPHGTCTPTEVGKCFCVSQFSVSVWKSDGDLCNFTFCW